ncbi:MAG: helix-turn-helix transcriptional regulator [Ruminococcaceae bacterium]|nr:helix-turn-helix transcriptional regulator [Oscillospiraceae bacterium]
MSISKNITKYRKQKGYTQEQLGNLLGVTNQSVSKWESAVSMPDVMMIPKIANALGITLEELYGIEKCCTNKSPKVTADHFPMEANKKLIEYFREQSGEDFHTNELEDPWSLICVSDISGAAHISNGLSFINTDYKAPQSERIFNNDEFALAMKNLSDRKVRTVLAYMYQASFCEKDTSCKSFSLYDISTACNLDIDEALDTMKKILDLKLLEPFVNDDNITEYLFRKSRAFYALTAFKIIEIMTQETICYEVVRDTSVINDYAFEKLW